MKGTIVRLLQDKGFGFIRGEDGVERFFHRTTCSDFDRLKMQETVEFVEGQSEKGARAEQVRRLTP